MIKIKIKKIVIIILFFSYVLVLLVVLVNYPVTINNLSLEEYGLSTVVVEDAKGFIDLIFIDENHKRQLLKSIPVEFVLIYEIENYKDTSLLKKVLWENHFKNSVVKHVSGCNLWSYREINGKGHDYFLLGEVLFGKYNGVIYKFMVFIQTKEGKVLDEQYRLWPFLKRYIINVKSTNFFNNLPSLNGGIEGNLRLNLNTLKVRSGVLTEYTKEPEGLFKYCRENSRWRPIVVMSTQKMIKPYQLLIIDLPMNNWYVNCFKLFNYDQLHITKRMSYVKKIYPKEYIEVRIKFLEQWLDKYNKYDRKYDDDDEK